MKAFAAALLALAFVAPFVTNEHCEGDHESECGTGCICVCCCAPDYLRHEQAPDLMVYTSEHGFLPDGLVSGRLLISDIFHPPISA